VAQAVLAEVRLLMGVSTMRTYGEGTNMTDQSKNRLDGKVDELADRGKSAFGELTGDEETRAEGELDQASGQLKQGVADLKVKADDVVRKMTDSES
jgi:uncharacterized protein YjbJ (UPF0337 family)